MTTEATVPHQLSALADGIREDLEAANNHWESAVGHAIAAGEKLIEAKRLVKHGQWLPWLETVGLPQKTANNYMRLAANQPRVADLPTVREALALLTIPKPDEPDDEPELEEPDEPDDEPEPEEEPEEEPEDEEDEDEDESEPAPKPKAKAKAKAKTAKPKPKPAPEPESPQYSGPLADKVRDITDMRTDLANCLQDISPGQVWRLDQPDREPDQVGADVLIELDRAALELSFTTSYLVGRLLRPNHPGSWGPKPKWYADWWAAHGL